MLYPLRGSHKDTRQHTQSVIQSVIESEVAGTGFPAMRTSSMMSGAADKTGGESKATAVPDILIDFALRNRAKQ